VKFSENLATLSTRLLFDVHFSYRLSDNLLRVAAAQSASCKMTNGVSCNTLFRNIFE